MLANEIQVIDNHPNFTLCLILKVASTTLRKWNGCYNIIDTHDLNFNNQVYALWRPSYDRMFSGLHTGLNSLAGQIQPKDVNANREEYINQFDEWVSNGMFDYTTKNYNLITEHTQFLQHLFRAKFKQINFIHINQIEYLSAFLNAKYNINSQPITENYNLKEDYGNRSNMQPISLLKSLLYKNPQVYRIITTHAAKDYVPNEFFDISKFC